ncbi:MULTISPECIES: endonuclease [Amycolatopsis]|uniref:Endonuclease n=1 Tax=Amycolatopsis dendrobii TaxID=2760662 RepID=A0A7W3W3X0_9PSEU|nr:MULTISPECIES: endonuclease [Amycolatopsis]MBB1158269.1 endonuclease [Amycolatopsis dendrobii]UKD56771.1 endonuclease [Amycolatopsis sp. FU40]
MRRVDELLAEHGTTFAEEAGIKLADKPQPLYRLLVLTTLLSTRISADIAVAAARELSRSGWRSPAAMRDSTWQQRVDALGRAHYVRYDESTSHHLGESAEFIRDEYRDDLRRMADAAGGDPRRLEKLITEFPRIGPTGAQIFCREAQAVWPWLRPYFDRKALDGAKKAGLPTDPGRLAKLVPGDDSARLAAALVRRSSQR